MQSSYNKTLPLTLNELKKRDGKPVYIKFENGESFGWICKNQWAIIHISKHIFATTFNGTLLVDFCIKNNICSFFDNE